MRGLDEPRKLKSIRARKGYIKYLWFEEGEEYNSPEDIRSVKQTVFRGGDSYVEFFSFNPPINPNHWVNKAIQEDDTRRMVHTSCYLDVKEEWLGNEFFLIANQLKKNNYDAYRHEYLGEPVGNPAEVVFSGKYRIEEFSTPSLGDIYQNRIFLGADWGFASDPTCLIQCFIMGDSLYIEYESYGYKTELDDIPALFNIIPDAKRWAIKADCSRPETISHVRRKGGFNLSGAPKWENSIIDGIEYIKAFKEIVIHPRCTNLIQEFDNYSYKVDKNTREVLPVLRDSWNHGIDALRYALSSYIKKNISAVDYV
jgi:phage terminase large subunit